MKRFLTPRNIVAALVVIALMVLSKLYLPVPLPHIQLPAETVFTIGGPNGYRVTNTMVTMFTADLILILLGLRVSRGLSVVPGRLQGFFELVYEYWKNMGEQLVGEDLSRKLLPLVLTMFFLIVTSNWIELVPGVDSVGLSPRKLRSDRLSLQRHASRDEHWVVVKGAGLVVVGDEARPLAVDA